MSSSPIQKLQAFSSELSHSYLLLTLYLFHTLLSSLHNTAAAALLCRTAASPCSLATRFIAAPSIHPYSIHSPSITIGLGAEAYARPLLSALQHCIPSLRGDAAARAIGTPRGGSSSPTEVGEWYQILSLR
ncbi:hypothetical protein PIB30_052965 [Stylosanthes scabra]|uniref:Uncharacterized protein n=1 Tax=Stylosanthes scabra TaxID=79078 RepID=A0ABU6SIV7_9FABA|nr:hypothetical protein [Stylosanthes scabra]